jgi:hypothetical protein
VEGTLELDPSLPTQAFLRSQVLFEDGEIIALQLDGLRLRARVVRVSRNGGGGRAPGMVLELLEVSKADRAALRALVGGEG